MTQSSTPVSPNEIVMVIDGHLVKMRFSDKARPDVYKEIKRMLLSSTQEKGICTFAEKEKM